MPDTAVFLSSIEADELAQGLAGRGGPRMERPAELGRWFPIVVALTEEYLLPKHARRAAKHFMERARTKRDAH